jgi:hypothetical protein
MEKPYTQPICCSCKTRESVLGQRMCRPCKAEYARKWRKDVGSRTAWKRGIDDAAEILLRYGMTDAAELVRTQLAA